MIHTVPMSLFLQNCLGGKSLQKFKTNEACNRSARAGTRGVENAKSANLSHSHYSNKVGKPIDENSACVEVGKPIDENPACVEVGTNSV
ncbi:hypothetical protein TNCV_4541901 [Trichonephila clavipes]|nr:hypothetical protein TNCV_4541901 [Trichonephila clavipes]